MSLNIACGKQIKLNILIKLLEKNFNKKIKIKYKPLQRGDVKKTFSDTKKLKKYIGKLTTTKFDLGIKKFCKWYLESKEKIYD